MLSTFITACSLNQKVATSPLALPQDGRQPADYRSLALEYFPLHQYAAFREQLAPALTAAPSNAELNYLNALSYHLEGGDANLALAQVGYRIASSVGTPSELVAQASYLLGLLELQRGQPAMANQQLTRAIIEDPFNSDYQRSLLASSTLVGDGAMALALALSLHESAQLDPLSWRVAVLLAAQLPQEERAELWALLESNGLDADFSNQTRLRQNELIQLAQFDANIGIAESSSSLPGPVMLNRQMGVEVTLILSDERRTKAYGLNLLDGLTAQYGTEHLKTSIRDTAFQQRQTQITRALRIPEITYNLNLFNRGNLWYDVVARPSITAVEGTTSRFFVGEQVLLETSGVNVASLDQVDIGVGLQLLPMQIREDGALLSVVAERSFFSDQSVGTFIEQLPTFKQRVEATADVKFGETLVLSGLSENVRDGRKSKTPLLGDIPGPDILFSRQTELTRNRSVIVLITPLTAVSVAADDPTQLIRERLMEYIRKANLNKPGVLSALNTLSKKRDVKSRITAADAGLTPMILQQRVRQVAETLGQPSIKTTI
ncbi:hypothetical protein IB286_13180 [Spongiibacter sp. KMU-158]|uniref:Type II/III secretion system secretin-like domain-containing protein n=1 Tax=Spongiibacter pelagi TaxID=2760804 RepID=A0A927C566_9GAMM|nr:hypothetical protein [Spongiibacter pelagi]MBD2859956.1 hypothetical protein [Spongiibacter pelagi]